mmetsp:Transcript_13114/g.20805  ORF Transcript_13114/g.20805 Transcript_13114/m.20805 type:complete len:339 (+) Transcript_13114:50-1066(+)|eukprot:CAMPEP_0197075064 /NCGR_PEP_ID=MMETSP1384-20130603/211424_1 /TAXON_ID=29189 /ORGANISM="Ammonia sp." /LENGTH=338 /DNA_ID=CAMNT_0042513907 /DNA_START=50 /DNA_END=1066 /DNA_ORIENTATION=-
MASFGMMNQAYFVGKNILIDWVNNFLKINIDKVEVCANGAIYCNIWDALHPGTIPMSRVDFTVKHEYDYTKNWKLLQTGFQKAGCEKVIPVQRLIKARYQDNLEFLQWMYKYARDTYNGDPDEPTYDAMGRRSKSKGGKEYSGSSSGAMAKARPRAAGNNRSSKTNISSGRDARDSQSSLGGGGGAARPISASTRTQFRAGAPSQPRGSACSSTGGGGGGGNQAVLEREIDELRSENKRLADSRDGLQRSLMSLQSEHDRLSNVAKDIEAERDFYFNKVVAIEQILKKEVDQNAPLLRSVYEILYNGSSQPPPPEQAQPQLQEQQQVLNQDIGSMQMD